MADAVKDHYSKIEAVLGRCREKIMLNESKLVSLKKTLMPLINSLTADIVKAEPPNCYIFSSVKNNLLELVSFCALSY